MKAARERGANLRIANVDARIRTVLELTSMDSVLIPYDTVEQANSNN